jgi:hypothetical protein
MATRMQQRRGTAAQWTAANPVLGAGEIGFETDTNKFKIGNGSTAWTSLSYFIDGASLIDGAPDLLNTLNELAAAIADDPAFFTTVACSLANSVSNLNNSLSGTANAVTILQGNVISAANNITDLQANVTSISNSLSGTQNTVNTQGGSITGITNSISTINGNITSLQNSLANTDSQLSIHANTTTSAHGISNTLNLAYLTDVSTLSNSLSNSLSTHESANTSVHGISNTLNLVYTNDSRLSDERTPSSTSVTAAKIASDAVETGKIANAAVTAAKLASDSVETAKIANGAVTDEKIANNIAQSHIANLTTDLGLLASQASVDLKAPLASPALTGTPTAPTANTATNTTQIATTAFVQQEIAILTDSAPGLLNTLDELAAALGDDENFAATTANSIALKAPLASPTFTGLVTVAANGIAYTDGTQTKEGVPSRTPIISKTASYTLSAESERDSLIEVSSASGTTITIPLNSAVAYPVGTTLDILQTNTGQVTIAGDAGVTVNATPGLKLRTQWSSATLFKRDTNTWVAFGDLTA